VGALTSASYRFKARPFDVVTTPSVCDHCSAGCTLTLQSRRGEIQRQLARTNMAVNEAWNCDKGRFGFTHLRSEQRITEPKLRVASGAGGGEDGDELVKASWADALLRVVGAVNESREQGPGRVAVVTGSRLPDEDAYALAKYVRTVLGTDDLDHRTRFAREGEDDELTALVPRETAEYRDVEDAPVIVIAGLDPREEVPILHLRLRKAWRAHQARIVVVGPHLGTLAELAWRRVPTLPGEEAEALDRLVDSDHEVAQALRDVDAPVVLVGERAGAGSIAAGLRLADAVGGKVGYVPRRSNARGSFEAGLAAGVLPGGRRLDDDTDRVAVEAVWGAGLPTERGRDLHAILTDAAAGRIDVLHLIGVDLVRDCDDPELARKALKRAKLVVAQDLARTDTVVGYADVVLPAAGTQERAGSYTDWEGRTQRFARAVDAPDLVQEDWEIVVQLAALLGHDLGFNDLDGIRAEVARLGIRDAAHDMPAPAAVAAAQAEGEASRGGDEAAGSDGLAVVVRPLLLEGGTMLAGAHDLLATRLEPYVAVNHVDADALGIADGDEVELAGAGTTVRLPARVGYDVVPGVVVVPRLVDEVTTAPFAAADGSGRVTLSSTADVEVGA
jgi:NADH-quinone oxidoreductase subunit G